jgi:hypothetical protein
MKLFLKKLHARVQFIFSLTNLIIIDKFTLILIINKLVRMKYADLLFYAYVRQRQQMCGSPNGSVPLSNKLKILNEVL